MRKILEECDAAGIFVTVNPDELDILTMYAIQVRYPGTAPIVDEAREAITSAKKVRKFARKYLNIK